MNLGDVDVDKMIESALGGGWAGIEDAGKTASLMHKEESRRAREEAKRQAAIIVKCFSSKAGRAALKLLIEKTLFRPQSLEERTAKTADHSAILASRREGQRDVVFMILDMFRVHAGEDPQHGGDT